MVVEARLRRVLSAVSLLRRGKCLSGHGARLFGIAADGVGAGQGFVGKGKVKVGDAWATQMSSTRWA